MTRVAIGQKIHHRMTTTSVWFIQNYNRIHNPDKTKQRWFSSVIHHHHHKQQRRRRRRTPVPVWTNVQKTTTTATVLPHCFLTSSSFCSAATGTGGGNDDDNLMQQQTAILARSKLGLGSHKWSQLMGNTAGRGNSNNSPNDTTTVTLDSDNTSSSSSPPPPSSSSSSSTMYQEIVETALANGVSTIEIGQDGGDGPLASILTKIFSTTNNNDNNNNNDETEESPMAAVPFVTLLKRVGYRTVMSRENKDNQKLKDNDDDDNNNNENVEDSSSSSSQPTEVPPTQQLPPSSTKLLPGDLMVEELPVPQTLSSSLSKDSNNKAIASATVVHNISRTGIVAALDESPLCQLHIGNNNNNNNKTNDLMKLIVLLHNPEVQGMMNGVSVTYEQRQARICDKLTESFIALEEEIQSSSVINNSKSKQQEQRVLGPSSYGIVSNGLALPMDHPLHLSWTDAIVPALEQAKGELQLQQQHKQHKQHKQQQDKLKFEIVQLPMNLWETSSLDVARQIKQYDPNLQIYAMRPLTAYPNQGTTTPQGGGRGRGHDDKDRFPVVFCDYQLPATLEKTMIWSNEMTAPPEVYQISLQAALRHFDALEILEAQIQQQEQELTTEQRETLDGCKLLQSLLHDVDVGLETMLSWEAHEYVMYNQIIPLIYDTFEGYDDNTATILQRFFAAYSLAVRYSIAQNTRRHHLLLTNKEHNKNNHNHHPTYPDLLPDMRLQDFALRFLLSQTTYNKDVGTSYTATPSSSTTTTSGKLPSSSSSSLVDKMIVGCTEADHILHDLEVVHTYLMMEQSSQQ